MTINPYVLTVFLSFLPISELRGAIPYAVANGIPLPAAAAIAFACNALVAPVAFIFLETFHKLFYRLGWYRSLFDHVVERTRSKVHASVEKYGYWGLMLFVAIPLPVTGAWTGTLAAWVFGMSRRKSMLTIALGVLISCVIVSLVVGLGVTALSLFIKQL
ncbi:MAG: ligand-binding protein SH3 [Treponema sp.]|nr:MAG: ligand-binding protein SH3 [Treponema sp.]